MRVVLIASAPPPALGLSAGLAAMGHEVAAVVSIRRPAGRYGSDYPQALYGAAPDGDLLFVRSGRPLAHLLRAYEPDLALCASFPSLIPDEALEVPRLGILNLHPGRLPRYRGPNPIGWALRNGDAEIGLTAHRMTSVLDGGAILSQGLVPVSPGEAPELAVAAFDQVSGRVLDEALTRLEAGDPGEPQDESQAGEAPLFEPEYVHVDWSRTAAEVHAQTRAWPFSPPVGGQRGPLATLDGERVRLLRTRLDDRDGGRRIECGDGPIWVLEAESA